MSVYVSASYIKIPVAKRNILIYYVPFGPRAFLPPPSKSKRRLELFARWPQPKITAVLTQIHPLLRIALNYPT